MSENGGPPVMLINDDQPRDLKVSYVQTLVALTILKNIRQWKGLSHILWKIKHV